MSYFNSKEYTFCNVEVFVLGRSIGGLRGIEYKKKKTKEVLFGAGHKGRAIQHGKREFEGTLTVLQSELIALDRAAKEAGLEDCLDLDFDISITYSGDNGIVTTDRIKGASITETPKALKEGDLSMEIALPFIALDVENDIE